MNNHRFPVATYRIILFVCDIIMAISAFLIGLHLTGWSFYLTVAPEVTTGFFLFSLVSIAFFHTYHLYNYNFLFSRKEHLKNISKAFFWSGLTIAIILFFINSSSMLEKNFTLFLAIMLTGSIVLLFLSRYLWDHLLDFLMAFGFAFLFSGITGLTCRNGIPFFMSSPFVISICFLWAVILLTINRLFIFHIVFNIWLRKSIRRQVVIVGTNTEAESISQIILKNNAPFWVVGTLGPPQNGQFKSSMGSKEWLGGFEQLPAVIKRYKIDDVVITDTSIDRPILVNMLEDCTTAGIAAWFSPKLLPIIDIKLTIDTFCGQPMIQLCSQKNSRLFNLVKNVVDLSAAILLLVILSPLLLLIALAIKAESRGPVFYRPEAIGRNVAVFLMYKFRSMKVDASNALHKNFVSQLIKGEMEKEAPETVLKITNDPRVTKVGRFIRKFSLDELPQLINVLKTEMSLVGPRPCLTYEFEMYKDWYKKRTVVRPGITGLWQVTGRSEVSFEDMILLDLYYIYNNSLLLDLQILFETVFVVLGKKGAF